MPDGGPISAATRLWGARLRAEGLLHEFQNLCREAAEIGLNVRKSHIGRYGGLRIYKGAAA